MAQIAATRRFRVHALHVDAHHARTLEAESFEAAAVAYIEDLHDFGAEQAVSVSVREVDSGHEHRFQIHVDPGASSAPNP
jgi:hypothetical protein